MSGDYQIESNGRMHHKCEGAGAWDDIKVDYEGDWELSLSAGDSKTIIKFCPWCGLELKVTG